ncbi:adhesion G protein-coupled receptor L3-like [Antedon mediterranea]|uniref:adhesion G protein-coupled receptor L3-like n=1 Tax=Antedon mediterranea TaxID=105859 RepID=UPI003AF5B84D
MTGISTIENSILKLFMPRNVTVLETTIEGVNAMMIRLNDSEPAEFIIEADTNDFVRFQPLTILENIELVLAMYIKSSADMINSTTKNRSLHFLEDANLDNSIHTTYSLLSNGIFSLSAFTFDKNRIQIGSKFQLPFEQIKKEEDQLQYKICAFINNQGLWSSKGCKMDAGNTCSCNHTTSYAVLMRTTRQVPHSDSHQLALGWISRVTIGLSLLGLILTLITYCCFRKLRNSDRSWIHCNLVSNLMILQSLFLFGIESTDHKYLCMIVAIGLHLTALNAFMWMLAEAVYIAFKVLRTTPCVYNKMLYYIIICYIVPVVAVAVSLLTTYNSYRDPYFCWINSENGLRWTFVGSVSFIELINCLILAKIIKCIYTRSRTNRSQTETEDYSAIKKSLKGLVILLPLFGVTWLVGPFMIGSSSLWLEYIFCIINGLQGCFIFCAYVLLDPQIRDVVGRSFGVKNKVSGISSTMVTRTSKAE